MPDPLGGVTGCQSDCVVEDRGGKGVAELTTRMAANRIPILAILHTTSGQILC